MMEEPKCAHTRQEAGAGLERSSFPPRDIAFNISEAYDPVWLGGDPARTALFDAFSLLLPDGERFFIRAVNEHLKLINEPRLRADIRAFCAQEAYHTREHELYNQALQRSGVVLDSVYARVREMLGMAKSRITRLSVTVAIEHLTACFGELALRPGFLDRAVPNYRDLWTWHALEELEHKAVAFDVFRRASEGFFPGKAYLLRCVCLLLVTRYLGRLHFALTLEILEARGHQPGLRTRAAALRAMFGAQGAYRLVFGRWLRFFVPGFSPASMSDPAALAGWRNYFGQMAALKRGKHAGESIS